MNRIEEVPLDYVISIYDAELPKEIRQAPPKVEEFVKKFRLDNAACPTKDCTGTLEHKASQDRAADEGMNIRFICTKCKRVVR